MTYDRERQLYASYNQQVQLGEAAPETKARGYESFSNISPRDDGGWMAVFHNNSDATDYFNEIQSSTPGFMAQVPFNERGHLFAVNVWPDSP